MTWLRIALANVRGVAVSANKISVLIERNQFLVEIFAQTGLVMTFRAVGDGNIWLQASYRSGFGYVDMTSRAFSQVLPAASFVIELH